MPVATKTVKAKVTKPTRKKWNLLNREYKNFQLFLHGQDVPLYSATKQQAEQLLEEIKEPKQGKEYPVTLRRDVIELEKKNTKIAKYWFKVPVADKWGGIWCPIKPHIEIKPEWSIRETELLKRQSDFYLHIVVQKEIEYKKRYGGVLGIDLGIRHLATTVELPNEKTRFLGNEMKKIRRKWLYLRKQTDYHEIIKKWGNKESKQIDDILHKVSRRIVDYAKDNDLLIFLGKLKGLGEKDRGKIMNEWINKFPYSKFRQYLEYKADWQRIPVIEVSERMTSQLCSRCGKKGERHKGRFKCLHCGYKTDADKVGATNIALRGLGKLEREPLSKLGVAVTLPESFLDEKGHCISNLLKEKETSKSSTGNE